MEAEALDGRTEDSPVGGELLKGSGTSARAKYRYQIAGSDLALDKGLERRAGRHYGLKIEVQVVDHQGDGAPHVLAACRTRPTGGRSGRLTRRRDVRLRPWCPDE